MKTVAAHDRPREKLQRVGAAALGDNELLAIVLGHGRANASALDIANAVLEGVAGLDRLARAGYDELRSIPGIGAARAAQIVAAVELGRRTLTRGGRERVQITSPRVLAEMLLPQFGSRPVEQFGVRAAGHQAPRAADDRRDRRDARREHRPPARDLP